MDSHRRRANARNVSIQLSLRWPIQIINPVDKIKLFLCKTRAFGTSFEVSHYVNVSLSLFVVTVSILSFEFFICVGANQYKILDYKQSLFSF